MCIYVYINIYVYIYIHTCALYMYVVWVWPELGAKYTNKNTWFYHQGYYQRGDLKVYYTHTLFLSKPV